MKKISLIIILLLCINCKGQQPLIEDLSNNSELNYIFSFLEPQKVIYKEFYNQFLFIRIYPIDDWLSTPNNFSPTDGEDVLGSYFISVKTADSYSNINKGKLFKIEGMYNSKILEVKESKYPFFTIKVEYETEGKKRIKIYKFKGFD